LSAVFDWLIKTHISLRLRDGSSLGALWELSGSSMAALWELLSVAGIVFGASEHILGYHICFQDLKIWFDCKSNLTSAISKLANCDIWQAMFPTIMPWPMTLAPTNEAIRRENHAEKNPKKEKKIPQ
jgi:hypothetical protein